MRDIVLVVIWSDNRTESRIPLFGQTIRIGHDAYNDVVLPPEFTPFAPYHAAITLQDDVCYIYDPDGVGSVFMNGKVLQDSGVIKPDIPAYVGSPTRSHLYLRLEVVDIQFTQVALAQTDSDMPTLPHFLESLPPANLPEHALPYLLVGWSGDSYEQFDLDQDVVIVGRSPAANIIIPVEFSYVSGFHFQIIQVDQHYFLQDKDSTNGTCLNRSLLEPNRLYRLTDGDVISIQVNQPNGLIWFVFHNPFSPKPTNITREPALAMEPLKLWERIRNFLRGS